MFVVVVGGGHIGTYLAALLESDGHRVTIIEKNHQRCEELKQEVGATVLCGDGNDPEVMRRADIRKADGLAAVTGDDEDNLVIGLLGRREFGVRRIVGRVNNPRNEWLFNSRMGIDAAVHPATVIAHLLEEEVTIGQIATLAKLRRGRVSLVEAVITDGAPAAGRTLRDVLLPANAAVVAVLRDGSVLVPTDDTVLAPGDEVLAVATAEAQAALANVLTGESPST